MPKKPKVKAKLTQTELPPGFFTAFKKEALLLANKVNEQFAKDTLKEIKETVRKQKFKWKKLSPEYLAKKKREGLDTRIYLATRDYINKGIEYRKKDGFIFVGPKEGTHKPSGLTYKQLARILEWGTWDGRIPARPLWRPVASKMLAKKKIYRKMYNEGIEKAAMRRARNKKKKIKRT